MEIREERITPKECPGLDDAQLKFLNICKRWRQKTTEKNLTEHIFNTLKRYRDLESGKKINNYGIKDAEFIIRNNPRHGLSEFAGLNHNDSVGFFSKTTNNRSFFPKDDIKTKIIYPNCGWDFNYLSSIFDFPVRINKLGEIPNEVKEYLAERINNKVICLFGGGKSIADIADNTDIKLTPKKIINYDPYSDGIDFTEYPLSSLKNIYESKKTAPDKENIVIEGGCDEIWASYSVPLYSKDPKNIKIMFDNIKNNLKKGGYARISPVLFPVNEGDPLKSKFLQIFFEEINKLTNDTNYNITFIGSLNIEAIEAKQISDFTESILVIHKLSV